MNYYDVLQEGLEHECGRVTHLSQEVQDRFSEELEVAIATWKHAMNEEVARVKKISEGLDKENQWQKTGFPLLDLEGYISKVATAFILNLKDEVVQSLALSVLL